MMIFRKAYLLVIIGLLAATSVYGATATDIIRKAHDAAARTSYRGDKVTRVVVGGRSVSSLMHVTHLKPDKTRTQYYSPKTLAGMVVVQQGSRLWKYSPREKTWDQVRSASVPDDGNLRVALANYAVKLIGSDRIPALRRDSYVILATPKHAGDPAKRIWIDKQTYLTLRSQTENANGEVTSSSGFMSLEINPRRIKPSAFVVMSKEKAPAAVEPLNFPIYKPKYLPKGYKLTGQSRDKVGGHLFVHLQFSNGVNSISLFQRCSCKNAKAPKVSDRLSSVLTWTKHEMLFTLIGDLPRAELRKIADSIS